MYPAPVREREDRVGVYLKGNEHASTPHINLVVTPGLRPHFRRNVASCPADAIWPPSRTQGSLVQGQVKVYQNCCSRPVLCRSLLVGTTTTTTTGGCGGEEHIGGGNVIVHNSTPVHIPDGL